MLASLFVLFALFAPAADQAVERQHVLTITAPDLDGGILSQITWDHGALLLQGVVANPDGSLAGRYVIIPEKGTTLARLKDATDASILYWDKKSKRTSPTGIGLISASVDSKMPMYGVSGLQQRVGDAADMGGMRKKATLRLGRLILHDREDGREPYDGEFWSWSPAEINRIAYVDGKGDLWIASADGRNPQRLLKGDFTLPAWSDDGESIAVAEKKEGGSRWEIDLILLPESLRSVK